MIKELNHIGLLTSDINASRDFYESALGGVVIRDHRDAEGSLFLYIQLALGVIELIRVPKNADNKGFVHVAYLIDGTKSLDEDYAYLSEKGYEFTLLPKSTAAGDGRLAFFKDHSGVLFELIQRDENVRIRDLVNPRIDAFHSIAINVSPETARECDAFYTTEMGFARSGAQKGQKTLYSIDGDSIELTETDSAEALAKPLSHISLSVTDCDETLSYLRGLDKQCSGIDDCGGGRRCFEVTGPDGETILIVENNTNQK